MRRLIIRPGAIGDLIVSLPALESLRAEETEVWVAEQNVPLVRFADRVRSIGSTGIDMLELGMASESLWHSLREFDEIVSWYGANREEFRSAVSGLPFRFFPALPQDASVHAADFYLAQVGAPLGAKPKIQAERWDGRFIAMHPLSSSPKKNWPREKFEQLAGRLPMDMQVEWCHDLLDNLYDLARWLAGARIFVGNDSGVAHLAAAVGTPVVAIFGPSNPAVWAPRGDRVKIVPIEADVDTVERAMVDCLRCEP